jgi:F-type H+-transporting ATPase subunit epsilon
MVLPKHAPLISALSAGKVVYTTAGEVKELVIQGGFVEVKNNVISVCVEK